ncbi:MAG: hypothetical protein HKO65_06190 [Gemmatimonadetes bacterium]|nr:hypothetical protein [Gemmatimonadota bacterium]
MGLRNRNRNLVLGLVLALVSTSGCSSGGSEFPEVEGWAQPGEVLVYDADNLWEYINGAAELFVSYGVRSCRTTDLTSGDLTVTVDLYDMGTPLNAYGVFEREASGEAVDVSEAVAALVSPPYQALLLKGSTYAKVNVFEGELTMENGTGLLEALAASLPGSATPPAEFGLLPADGMVPGSEAYQAEAFLGLTELTDCVFADYSQEGEESWQGFVVLPEAAQEVWDGLTGEWSSFESGGSEVLFREVPYRGLVGVTWTDQNLIGVSGAADQDALLARLEAFAG